MQIKEAILDLGLDGKPVCIHASLRSFGCRVSGLLEAFEEMGCTVLAPTFSDMYEAPPVKALMPAQNGAGDYSYFLNKAYEDVGAYSPQSNLLTVEEMGQFPQTVLAHPRRVRGGNALNSFAAVGPLAQTLVQMQTNTDVYAPLERLYALDGFVLLMGVGLNSATAIHYAEQRAGRAPFVRWAKDGAGNTVPVRAGGCSKGFEKLRAVVKPYEKQVAVFGSLWRCYRIRDLVDVCCRVFLENPLVAHCGDAACDRCNDAAKGGPVWQAGTSEEV